MSVHAHVHAHVYTCLYTFLYTHHTHVYAYVDTHVQAYASSLRKIEETIVNCACPHLYTYLEHRAATALPTGMPNSHVWAEVSDFHV